MSDLEAEIQRLRAELRFERRKPYKRLRLFWRYQWPVFESAWGAVIHDAIELVWVPMMLMVGITLSILCDLRTLMRVYFLFGTLALPMACVVVRLVRERASAPEVKT